MFPRYILWTVQAEIFQIASERNCKQIFFRILGSCPNAFADYVIITIRNHNKRSGPFVNSRRQFGQDSTMRVVSVWLREFKRNSNVVSNRSRFFIAHFCMSFAAIRERLKSWECVHRNFFKRRNYVSWHFILWRNTRLI